MVLLLRPEKLLICVERAWQSSGRRSARVLFQARLLSAWNQLTQTNASLRGKL